MPPLWLLKGGPDAPGWADLQRDAQQEKVNVLHFDQDAWALVKVDEAPTGYQGLEPQVPPDGNYLDRFGRPCYVLGAREVHSARVVVAALGDKAAALMDKYGDADLVLERLGRTY